MRTRQVMAIEDCITRVSWRVWDRVFIDINDDIGGLECHRDGSAIMRTMKPKRYVIFMAGGRLNNMPLRYVTSDDGHTAYTLLKSLHAAPVVLRSTS